jgi:hypothetical protein
MYKQTGMHSQKNACTVHTHTNMRKIFESCINLQVYTEIQRNHQNTEFYFKIIKIRAFCNDSDVAERFHAPLGKKGARSFQITATD